uniref:Spermatogenesis associated 4 n=1 Tax=Apteryx owenii TaxID=8824 RepID=A0A8B9S4Y2_APTOW
NRLTSPKIPFRHPECSSSLDLSVCPRHCRRCGFSNGYLVAEILSCYYPADIQRRAYDNGSSLAAKLSNWSRLRRFFAKQKLNLAEEVIDGTIHCKPGAAEILVQDIYSMLTNRRIQDREIDFTDYYYQAQLPMAARSTASKAIKNNIKLTEIMIEPSVNINRQKVNAVINMHLRIYFCFKERFNIKPSLGQRAVHHLSCTTASENIVNILKEKLFIPQKSEAKKMFILKKFR